MVSHLLYYQLALFALVWLFIMVHLTWPQAGVTAPAVSAALKPLTPKRHRSSEPTPFAGLTHKPPCALLTGCKFSVAQTLYSSAQIEGHRLRRERCAEKNAWDSELA
jgi:hypothetical protein